MLRPANSGIWRVQRDTVRAELDPNGLANIPEFGTVREATGFQALHAMVFVQQA